MVNGIEWRVIEQATRYEVNNLGMVRNSKTRKVHTGREQDGYIKHHLQDNNGNRWHVFAHQLVAHAFLGPCPKGLQVRHLNDIGCDNRVNNLAYGTTKQQGEDRRRLAFPVKRLSRDDVVSLRMRFLGGETASSLAKDYGIDHSRVCDIIRGKTFKKLPGAVKESLTDYHLKRRQALTV